MAELYDIYTVKTTVDNTLQTIDSTTLSPFGDSTCWSSSIPDLNDQPSMALFLNFIDGSTDIAEKPTEDYRVCAVHIFRY